MASEANAAGHDFLGPPQQPGELGRLASYRVLRLLGSGGMGLVFEAEDVQLKRLVALKVMKPVLAASDTARRRFLREAQLAAALDHDHIVHIYQVGEDRDVPFLAMQLLKGESLEDRLRHDRRLPGGEMLRIGREIAAGLAAAHASGMIHRDIKPGNVWLEGERSRVKLLDFGLARAMSDEAGISGSGVIAGTPAYMAPEQARGETVDARADLFSLGCVLYRMTTGATPFKGSSPMAVLAALAVDQPLPPSEVNPAIPEPLSRLVMQLLEKSPAQRLGSANDVIAALDRVNTEPTQTFEPSRPHDTPDTTSRPRRRWRRTALVLAGLAALIGLVFAGTLIRIVTNRGELVVELDDPNIVVQVKGGAVMLEDTGTKRRYELRAGNGEVEFRDPDGGAVALTRTFRIERGGKVVVKASVRDFAPAKPAVVPDPPPAPTSVEKPFVVQRKGGKRDAYRHLTEALASLDNGAVMEIHGNGPFCMRPARLQGVDLVMKAAPGYRPVLVAGKETEGHHLFLIERCNLQVEGLDFRVPPEAGYPRLFAGSGDSWEVRNCRVLGSLSSVVNYLSGPRLRIADCLLSNAKGPLLSVVASAEFDLTNNILRTTYTSAVELSGGGQKVRMHHNTVVQTNEWLTLGRPGNEVNFDATANIIQAGGMIAIHGTRQELKEKLRWQGSSNLYLAGTRLFAWSDPVKLPGKDLVAWNEFWGRQEASWFDRQPTFAWSILRGADKDAAIAAVKLSTETARQRFGLKDLGPDWDLVGPGEAYVRALAAADMAVAKDRLRPPAPPGGPMVLTRGGKAVKAFITLQDAANSAQPGDAIVIHGDGPYQGAALKGGPEPITIRAAVGYRPVITSEVKLGPGTRVVVEGLHFREAHIGFGNSCGILRVKNCAFTGVNQGVLFLRPVGKERTEVINCLIDRPILCLEVPGEKLLVRNSLIGGVHFLGDRDGVAELEIDRSVVWNPGFSQYPAAGSTIAHSSGAGKGLVAIKARRTLFEAGSSLISSYLGTFGIASWHGSKNVYRIGTRRWADGWAAESGNRRQWLSLENMRQVWHCDEDSFEDDPLDYDPRQWRLLPGSPGYQALPGGKDIGPDTTRIGVTAPRSR